jgi:hypothetical protein
MKTGCVKYKLKRKADEGTLKPLNSSSKTKLERVSRSGWQVQNINATHCNASEK